MNNINSVKMVREIRDKQYEENKGKSTAELKKYYKKNSAWAFSGEKAKQTQKAKKKRRTARKKEECAKLTSP